MDIGWSERHIPWRYNTYFQHQSTIFFVKTRLLLLKNADPPETDLLFITPSDGIIIHAKAKIRTGGSIFADIYYDTVISDVGTPIVPHCANQIIGDGYNLLPYTDPIVTDVGTLMWSAWANHRNPLEVSPEHGYEIIVKKGTNYLWRLKQVENEESIWVDVDFHWCEHLEVEV